MTARPPSSQYPSDEDPGRGPAATGARTGPPVPPTFLPDRARPRTEARPADRKSVV